MTPLKKCIDDAGGVPAVSVACRVSPRAVYKWLASDSLPRTEYTGETRYAETISKLAAANGKPFDPAQLLSDTRPNRAAA